MPKTPSPEQLLTDARKAASSGKYKTAIKHYVNYSKLAGVDADVCLAIGELCEQSNDEFSAIDWYEKGAELVSDNAEPYIRMARILNEMLRSDEALDCANKALKREADSASALIQKCVALEELIRTGAKDKSAKLKETASHLIEVRGDSYEGYCYRGRAYAHLEKPNQALQDFKFASTLRAEHPLSDYFEAQLYYEQNELGKALSLLESAYDAFHRRKLKRYEDDAANLYHIYKELLSKSARRARTCSLEDQIKILEECGIKTKNKIHADRFLEQKSRVHFEENEPFLNTLIEMSYRMWCTNMRAIDAECIENDGDYAEIARIFVEVAEGDFELHDIRDSVFQSDDKGECWLMFQCEGKEYKWKPKWNYDWLDQTICHKLGALLKKSGSLKRFAAVWEPSGSQNFHLVCLQVDQISSLKEKTGLDITVLE